MGKRQMINLTEARGCCGSVKSEIEMEGGGKERGTKLGNDY